MRKTLAALVVVLGVASGLAAQDFYYRLYAIPMPAETMPRPSNPCVSHGGTKQIAPLIYERVREITFLCQDDEVITVRFRRPSDNIVPPQPVYLTPSPVSGAGQSFDSAHTPVLWQACPGNQMRNAAGYCEASR